MPGCEPGSRPRATPVGGILELISAVLDRASPGRPATLLLHDWGCVFGYEFAARHPERVARVIGVDVGDHNAPAFLDTLATRVKLGVVAYQVWLSLAWFLGGATGDAMTRWMARRRGCPTDPSLIGWRMTYPYAMRWFGVAGGMGGLATVEPRHPTLYLYSRQRAGMFHSRQWLEQLAALPGSAAHEFPTGHWLMSEQPEAFARCVAEWLDAPALAR
jgi:pimeloyl-ACP methyl ester carboxylesterase